MSDTAYTLAAVRAGRARPLNEHDRAEAAAVAAQLGRRLVEVYQEPGGTRHTLGFTDGHEPDPSDGVFAVRRLSPVPLVALAACLGLCWSDRDDAPYPGVAVAVDRVLEVTGALGADRAHTLGAIRHELSLSGLVELAHGEVNLGPAIAAWTDAQVDTLRRFADILPGADDA